MSDSSGFGEVLEGLFKPAASQSDGSAEGAGDTTPKADAQGDDTAAGAEGGATPESQQKPAEEKLSQPVEEFLAGLGGSPQPDMSGEVQHLTNRVMALQAQYESLLAQKVRPVLADTDLKAKVETLLKEGNYDEAAKLVQEQQEAKATTPETLIKKKIETAQQNIVDYANSLPPEQSKIFVALSNSKAGLNYAKSIAGLINLDLPGAVRVFHMALLGANLAPLVKEAIKRDRAQASAKADSNKRASAGSMSQYLEKAKAEKGQRPKSASEILLKM